MNPCYRCGKPNPVSPTFIANYTCCKLCLRRIPAPREEIKALEQRVEALRLALQRAPFYQDATHDQLTPCDYGQSHAETLLARKSEIEQAQEVFFSDSIFTNFLKGYHQDIFDLATFEVRALTAVAQERQRTDESMHRRLQELTLRYQNFDYYEDAEWIKNYAALNRRNLLERRDKIIDEYRQLHTDDAFTANLREYAPHIYNRAVWEVKALAAAERIKETPEEYHQRHARTSWLRLKDELSIDKEAIKQSIFKELSLEVLQKELEEEFPEEFREIVHRAFQRYKEGEQEDGQPKPSPEIY